MGLFRRIFIFISISILLIGCSNKEIDIDENVIHNEQEYKYEEWLIKTKDLILSSEVEKNKYIDYRSLLDRETSLDDTWRAVNVLNMISQPYNKSSIYIYINSYNTDDKIEQIMLNSIADIIGYENIYNINYNEDLSAIINNTNDVLEKLDMIYLYHFYGDIDISKLDKNLRTQLKEFLANIKIPKDSHYGYFYDLTFLCEKYNITSRELDSEFWKIKLRTEISSDDFIKSYFILKINLALKNSITPEQIQLFFEIQEISSAIKDEKNDSIMSSYLMTDISKQTGQLNGLNKDIIKKSILNQQSENGGFYIRKTLNPDLTASILANNILVFLEEKDKSGSQEGYSEVFSSELSWKVKYFGYNLFTKDIHKKNQNELKKELAKYYELLMDSKIDNLYSDVILYEDILYAMQLSDKINMDVPKEIHKIMLSTSKNVLENLKDFSPVEISLAVDTFTTLKVQVTNEQEVSSFLSSYYNRKLNRFVYKNRDEMMINYYIIKSLISIKNDFTTSEIKSILMEFAELDKGGINNLKDEFETSSLITTFYGIALLSSL
ncbi:hypothetical protein [Lysinibacillus fusiformis]|uniref:Lipoprotein n=1 Tax=Lysinibacillus fusiformis TaxID=28031 RepID=A0A1E4R5G0_9BACI|nr:hypothetical protein [Lysinibacillus fusiformis]ODV55705.1 hypothetical protein BG258_07210 [Lysinibacillus fusiformis]